MLNLQAFWVRLFWGKVSCVYPRFRASAYAMERPRVFKGKIIRMFKHFLIGGALPPHPIRPQLANHLVLDLVKSALYTPAIRDLEVSAFPRTQPVVPFLFSPPILPQDYAFGINGNIGLSVFYLITRLRTIGARLCFISLLYLEGWLCLEFVILPEAFFYLLEQQKVLLSSGKTFVVQPLPPTPKFSLLTLVATPTKKRKSRKRPLNYATREVMRFLINLTRISSRAGARARNFGHLLSFLKKLRMLGGYNKIYYMIKKINPFFYFRKRYRGRKSFYVPRVIPPQLRFKFTGRILLKAALKRTTERGFSRRLIMEVVDALRQRGAAYRYKSYALNFTNVQKFNIRRIRFRTRLFRKRTFY